MRPGRDDVVLRPGRDDIVLRPGRDDDAAGFIDLIAACWAEYPGCVLHVDAEVPELLALASHYARVEGFLVAAELDGRIVGMAAVRPNEACVWEVCKVYVAAAHRGAGLAQRLMAWTEAHARKGGAQAMCLWSDTRFERAHRFYEKLGFIRSGPARALNDLSDSHEYPFRRAL